MDNINGDADSLGRNRLLSRQKTVTKLVYQPGVQFVKMKHSKKAECVFGECELPKGEYRFAVAPSLRSGCAEGLCALRAYNKAFP